LAPERLATSDNLGMSVATMNDWAARQFVVCFRSDEDLTLAASQLLDFLESKGSKL